MVGWEEACLEQVDATAAPDARAQLEEAHARQRGERRRLDHPGPPALDFAIAAEERHVERR